MKVTQKANCKNSPKNQTVADFVHALLTGDETFVNEKYDAGIESVGLPPLENVKEITIDSAISHGKEAACLCTYNLNEKTHHIGFFLEFTTPKATAFASIVVTSH